MCGIQNVTRKQGTYYYRKLIRLGADKPFRIRFSLKTTSRRRAGLLAPALTLICERVAMNMMSNMAGDGLDAAQRAEIFRRQILVERDRLEAMHASLHVLPPEDYDDIGKALTLRLGASEMAAQDGAMQGKIEDFLVARVDPDNEDEDIVVLAWSDLAASIEHEWAEKAAVARLAELDVEQSALREAMARKVVNEARIVAIREFREVLANPGASYAPVPRTEYEPTAQYVASPPVTSAPPPTQPAVPGPYATMTATEALAKFFAHNPRTGGKDGQSRRKNGQAWIAKTRKQAGVAARFLVKGQANHSFRHTAIDTMKAARISSELRADFAGHKLTSETEGRYSNAHMELLREAAETIPKVTEDLEPQAINLLPKRLRQPRKARRSVQTHQD